MSPARPHLLEADPAAPAPTAGGLPLLVRHSLPLVGVGSVGPIGPERPPRVYRLHDQQRSTAPRPGSTR